MDIVGAMIAAEGYREQRRRKTDERRERSHMKYGYHVDARDVHYLDPAYVEYRGKFYKTDRLCMTLDEDIYMLFSINARKGDWYIGIASVRDITEITEESQKELIQILYG